MNTNSEFEKTRGKQLFKEFRIQPQQKIIFSIVSTFVWLGFSLYWMAFLWSNYTGIQNIALLMISFMVSCATNAILWVVA